MNHMNKERIVWGVILLAAGLVLLLENMGVINFYWGSVFRLWPVILIVVGLNMLMPKSGVGSVLTLVVSVAAVAFLAYAGTQGSRFDWWNADVERRVGIRESRRTDRQGGRLSPIKNLITHEMEKSLQTAVLQIKGGAVEYEIEKPSRDFLFWAESESVFGPYLLEYRETDSVSAELIYRMTDSKLKNWNFKGDENEAKIRLHPDPIWSIQLEMGAGAADFDLREYQISQLKMECGAASVEAKMGAPVGHSEIHVESGAASIEIEIPRSAACRIMVSSALSSRDFQGFEKQSDGSFTTPGYAESGDRYTIRLEGGISSFTVKRN